MIDLPLLLAFLAAASVLTITPGVDTAMVLRTAAGRRPEVSAVGVNRCRTRLPHLGRRSLTRALAATACVGTRIYRFKFAGAAYLIWLGVKMLVEPRAAMDISAAKAGSRSGRDAFTRGFLTNILNPNVSVFYVTSFPEFVPSGAMVAGYSLFLTCLHVGPTLAWSVTLTAATIPLDEFLRRPKAVRTLHHLAGSVFVVLGVQLATSSAR